MDDNSEATEMVSVTFPNHHEMLVNRLWEFLQKNHRVDLFFQWAGRPFQAHELIVEVFLAPEKLGSSSMELRNLDTLLEFLYKGTVSVAKQELDNLLQVAKQLDLAILTDAIQVAIQDSSALATTSRPDSDEVATESDSTDDDLSEDEEDNNDDQKSVSNDESNDSLYTPGSSKRASDDKGVKVTQEMPSTTKKPVRKSPKTFCCRSCNHAYHTHEILASHTCTNIFSQYRMFQCHHCSWKSPRVALFLSHLASHDPSIAVVRCQICKEPKTDTISLERHMERVHAVPRQCPFCDYRTIKSKNFRSHLFYTHKLNAKGESVTGVYPKRSSTTPIANDNQETPATERPTFFDCKACNHAFVTEEARTGHKCSNEVSTYRVFDCHHCSYSSSRINHFNAHLTMHDASAAVLKCPTCKVPIMSLKAMRRHMASHSEFTCPLCDYVTTKMSNYRQHLSLRHMSVDKGEGGQAVVAARNEHQLGFKCRVCNHAYQTREVLNDHSCSGVFSTTKTFDCHHCSYSSQHIARFRAHLACHDPTITVLRCPTCKIPVINAKTLQRHVQTQHPSFECPHCPYKTVKIKNYRQHLSNHHQVNLRGEPIGRGLDGEAGDVLGPLDNSKNSNIDESSRHSGEENGYLGDSLVDFSSSAGPTGSDHNSGGAGRHTYGRVTDPTVEMALTLDIYRTESSRDGCSYEDDQTTETTVPSAGILEGDDDYELPSDEEATDEESVNEGDSISDTEESEPDLPTPTPVVSGKLDDTGDFVIGTQEAMSQPFDAADQLEDSLSNQQSPGDSKSETDQPPTQPMAVTYHSARTPRRRRTRKCIVANARRGRPPNREFHTCKECNHAFQTEQACSDHTCTHLPSTYKVFQCHHCGYDTFRVSIFRVHLASHDPTVPVLRCSTCQQAVPDERALERHMETHVYKSCPHCSFRTNLNKSLALHLLRQHQVVTPPASHGITTRRKRVVSVMVDQQEEPGAAGDSDGSEYTPGTSRRRSARRAASAKAVSAVSAATKTKSTPRPTAATEKRKRLKVFRCKQCNYGFLTEEARAGHTCSLTPSRYKKFQCHLCAWTSFRSAYFLAHLATHDPTISVLRCPTCKMPMLDAQALERHMATHEKDCLCPHCGFTTDKDKVFRSHLRIVHKVTSKGEPVKHKYNCDRCVWHTNALSEYEVHIAKHVDPNVALFRCSGCYMSFLTEASKANHTCSKKRTRKKYKCTMCPYMTQREALFKRHCAKRHGTNDKVFRCRYCPEPFASAKALKRHKQTQHLLYACPLCQFETNSTDDYHYHVKLFHRDAADPPPPPRREENGAGLDDTSEPDDQLDERGDRLAPPKNDLTASIVGCGACNHAFLSEESLETHQCTKVKARHCVFVCPLCEYVTEVKARYMIHFSKHDNTVASYRCDICKVPYASAECLERHKQTHRVYQCRHCSFQTPRYNEIYVHRKTHVEPGAAPVDKRPKKRKWTDSD